MIFNMMLANKLLHSYVFIYIYFRKFWKSSDFQRKQRSVSRKSSGYDLTLHPLLLHLVHPLIREIWSMSPTHHHQKNMRNLFSPNVLEMREKSN